MKFDQPQFDKNNPSTEFLDMKIKIVGNRIVTDQYRKVTDKPTALLPSSAHLGHIIPNILDCSGYAVQRNAFNLG